MRLRILFVLMGLVASAQPAAAQQRPLVTEDPETIGPGLVLVEAGLDWSNDIFFPVSGLRGDLLRLPTLGLSVGVGSIVEIQIDGGLYNRLAISERRPGPLAHMVTAQGASTSSVEDLVVGTKIRLLAETPQRAAVGLRFATKLPNAGNESGLGLDTTDFYVSALVAKTIQSLRVVGNLGLGILADPTRGDRQNDVLLYGISFARAVAQGTEVVGEFNGRASLREGDPLPGSENRALMRLGGRYTRGPARADAALLVGMTSRDPSIGFTVGVTYVFKGFTVP